MEQQVLTTGDLARATGETVRTVRFYREFRSLLRDRLPAHVQKARDRIERLRRLEAELRQALRSVSEDDDGIDDPGTAPCPCVVGATHGAPRIVRVLARTGECAGMHARQSA
jgi:hypothetical protein